MLKDILIRTTEQRILSFFAANPDKSFYGREVSKRIKTSLGATSNALRLLERRGILTSEKKGKTSLYMLKLPNPCMEYFRILNSILQLESLIEKLKGISSCVIIYGSYATGTFSSDSDLDLFIVSEKRDETLKLVEDFGTKVGLEISPVVKKKIEWMELEKKEPEFFNELKRGITLWEKPINESGF